MGTQVNRFVMDNSIAMRWRFAGRADHQSYADAILSVLDKDENVSPVVPPLWHIEAANVILCATAAAKKGRRKLTAAEMLAFCAFLGDIGIETDGDRQELAGVRVLLLAREHGLSAYDASYLELALRRGLPIATNDDGLRAAAVTAGVPLYLGGFEAFA